MEQKYKSRKGMAEHRFVIEEHFGRKLKTNEHVHHINGDKTDNRLKNLVVMTPKAHMFIHKQKYPIFKKCRVCYRPFKPLATKRKRNKVCSIKCKIKLDKINAGKRKRPIEQYSKERVLLKTWDSARDIQITLGMAESNINKCCNRKIKSAYGYVWKYADIKQLKE